MATNIVDLAKDSSFYKQPVKDIISVLSKTDFNEYEDSVEIIKQIITETIKTHPDDPETKCLIQAFDEDRLPQMNLQECVDILQSFTNLDLCVKLGEQFSLPDIDYQVLYEQKCKENEGLKERVDDLESRVSKLESFIEEKFPPKPVPFEPNLLQAINKGDLESVKWLIEQGHHIWDNKIFIQAAGSGHLNIVQYFVEHGANLNLADNYGTPLIVAIGSNHMEIVQYLVEHGADVNLQSPYGGPLCYAISSKRLDVVRYLVEHGAYIDWDLDKKGNTALHIAASCGHLEIAQYLLSKGANKQALNKEKKRPKDVVSSYCDYNTRNTLLKLLA